MAQAAIPVQSIAGTKSKRVHGIADRADLSAMRLINHRKGNVQAVRQLFRVARTFQSYLSLHLVKSRR